MGQTPRKLIGRRARVLKPTLMGSFYAYEPSTTTAAARLFVIHLWSGLPYGPSPARQRHAVCISKIVDDVIVGSRLYPAYTEATNIFNDAAATLEKLKIDVVAARDRFEEITGRRFDQCGNCRANLNIAALWCTDCGTPANGRPRTSGQHSAAVLAANS